jgi:hypothetical protein
MAAGILPTPLSSQDGKKARQLAEFFNSMLQEFSKRGNGAWLQICAIEQT